MPYSGLSILDLAGGYGVRAIRCFGAQAVAILVLAGSVRAENYKGFERAEALITPGRLKALIDEGV